TFGDEGDVAGDLAIEIAADGQSIVGGDGDRAGAVALFLQVIDLDMAGAFDVQHVVRLEVRVAIPDHVDVLLAADFEVLIVEDLLVILVLDERGAVALDEAVEVALGTEINLLALGRVLEGQLVVTHRARRALRADAAAGLVL